MLSYWQEDCHALHDRHWPDRHAVAAGGDLEVKDDNIPEQLVVKTNKVGPLEGGMFPYLGGKEAIDKMTVAEFVDTFSTVMGQTIVYHQLPLDKYLASLPKPLRPLFRWYDEVGYEADVASLREEYPDLTTLDAYLRATGWENWQPAK